MTKKIFDTPEIITVEQADAVIKFCADHGSEIAYVHKDGKIFCEYIKNLDVKNGVTKL